MALEVFKLFGSIFVNTDDAEKSIHKTDSSAKKVAQSLGNGIKTAAKWGTAVVGAAVDGAAVAGAVVAGAATRAGAFASAGRRPRRADGSGVRHDHRRNGGAEQQGTGDDVVLQRLVHTAPQFVGGGESRRTASIAVGRSRSRRHRASLLPVTVSLSASGGGTWLRRWSGSRRSAPEATRMPTVDGAGRLSRRSRRCRGSSASHSRS